MDTIIDASDEETSSPTDSERHSDDGPFEDPMHPARWKHRRRMAYSSLISVFVVTAYLLIWADNDRIAALNNIVEWFYLSMITVVGSYMGFASISAVWNRRKY